MPGVVPEDFIVGVKLNAADYARDTSELQENRALEHVREIGTWGLVDTIQVSGGDYEDPRTYPGLACTARPSDQKHDRVHRHYPRIQIRPASRL